MTTLVDELYPLDLSEQQKQVLDENTPEHKVVEEIHALIQDLKKPPKYREGYKLLLRKRVQVCLPISTQYSEFP